MKAFAWNIPESETRKMQHNAQKSSRYGWQPELGRQKGQKPHVCHEKENPRKSFVAASDSIPRVKKRASHHRKNVFAHQVQDKWQSDLLAKVTETQFFTRIGASKFWKVSNAHEDEEDGQGK